MARQLVLLDNPHADWHLDEATRVAGKRGIAAARAALALVVGGNADGAGNAGHADNAGDVGDVGDHPTHMPAA